MALSRYDDDDNDFFMSPFRTLLDPRFRIPSAQSVATPIKLDVFEVINRPELDRAPCAAKSCRWQEQTTDSLSIGTTCDLPSQLQKDNGFTVRADVPGIPKERVRIFVEGDLLNVSVDNSGSQTKTYEARGLKVHRYAPLAFPDKRIAGC